MTPHWEHFNHDADIGIRGIGSTLDQAFEQAAIAMTAVITDPAWVSAAEIVSISCHAADKEMLLMDWINELVFLMSTRRLVFSSYQVSIDDGVLTAVASGEAVDVKKHQPAVEIKGATFTELRVYQNPDGAWVAQCVVDV
ncbi:MAG: archease [Methylococcaceae bacterium]